jgi:hypothetical protein
MKTLQAIEELPPKENMVAHDMATDVFSNGSR